MKDKDTKILKEAYKQINEGVWVDESDPDSPENIARDKETVAWKSERYTKKGEELKQLFLQKFNQFIEEEEKASGPFYWGQIDDLRGLSVDFMQWVQNNNFN